MQTTAQLINHPQISGASQSTPVVSLSKNRYTHFLVLVGSKNEFEQDFVQQNCCFPTETK